MESNALKEGRLKDASAQILELKARVLELQSELEEKAQK